MYDHPVRRLLPVLKKRIVAEKKHRNHRTGKVSKASGSAKDDDSTKDDDATDDDKNGGDDDTKSNLAGASTSATTSKPTMKPTSLPTASPTLSVHQVGRISIFNLKLC